MGVTCVLLVSDWHFKPWFITCPMSKTIPFCIILTNAVNVCTTQMSVQIYKSFRTTKYQFELVLAHGTWLVLLCTLSLYSGMD